MTILDKNQTLEPPAGYTPISFVADGEYLRAEYHQNIFWAGTSVIKGENVVIIYLNDQGREVARCIDRVNYPEQPKYCMPVVAKPAPLSRWEKFVEWLKYEWN